MAALTALIKAVTKGKGCAIIINAPMISVRRRHHGAGYACFNGRGSENTVQWGYGSWPGGPTRMEGAKALAGVRPADTATTLPSSVSRVKTLSIEPHQQRRVLCVGLNLAK